jgi:hypothetical protein
MTRAEKRQHVWQLLKENATRSNREIGRIAGVSHVAVGTMRKKFEAESETYHPPSAETYHPLETYHQVETYAGGNVADLANDPIEDIAAKVPVARRAALVKALVAGSSQAKRPDEWKYRTSAEVRAAIIAAHVAGMGIVAISEKFGVKRQTAHSIIRVGK